MSKQIKLQFAEESWFEVPTEIFTRGDHPAQASKTFERLKKSLIEAVTVELEDVRAPQLVKNAANEAAALSWTTPFPVLFFPLLLSEKLQQARIQAHRQDTIMARSESLLACSL
jgi:hypothetical protein